MLSAIDLNAGGIATLNPIRYRSYYYDTETGLYYLNSRYYDPETGRFVNGDGFAATGQGVLGNNMFAYCGNNPVNRADSSGQFWKTIGKSLEKFFNAAVGALKIEFGMGKGFGHSGKEGLVKYSATTYKDSFTIGFDNGNFYTATTGRTDLSVGIEKAIEVKAGVTYKHAYEGDNYCSNKEHTTHSSSRTLYHCPDAEIDSYFEISVTDSLDEIESYNFSHAKSYHLGIGIHYEISWDFVQFVKLFREED